MVNISYITTSNHDLGLRSISSYLKNKKLQTAGKLFALTRWGSYQYNKEELDNCITAIKKEKSDFYFLTIRELDRKRTFQLAKAIKENIPQSTLVVGGDYALSNPNECMKYFDYVVQGEGEVASEKIIKKTQKKGITFFPEIAKKDLPLEDYSLPLVTLATNSNEIKIETNRVSKKFIHHQYPNQNGLPITTQRGCSYNCSYCGVSQLRKKFPEYGLRKLDLRKIVKHISNIINIDKTIDYIYFLDEDFLLKTNKEIETFAEEYKEQINMPFFIFTTPSLAVRGGKNKLESLINAGLNQINIGIQSGSEEISKKLYERRESNKEKLEATNLIVNLTRKYDLQPPMFDFIILNPYETKQDMLKTIQLIKNLPKPFKLIPHTMNFFGGTELKIKAIQDEMITEDYALDFDLQNFIAHTEDLRRIRKIDNFYLSSIIYRMWGEHNNSKMGSLTKKDLEMLLSKKVMKQHLKNEQLIRKENENFPNPMNVYPENKY